MERWIYKILITICPFALLFVACDGCLPGHDIMAQITEVHVLKADSNGVIVELREKYGPVIYDTGTVVSKYKDFWVITKKKDVAWYPVCNYSIKIKE